jgi:hypothetical protein
MPDDAARLEDARGWLDKATLDLRAGDLLVGSSDAGLLGNAAFVHLDPVHLNPCRATADLATLAP